MQRTGRETARLQKGGNLEPGCVVELLVDGRCKDFKGQGRWGGAGWLLHVLM